MTPSPRERSPSPRRPLWRRWWALLGACVLLLMVVGALAGEPEDEAKEQAARVGPAAAAKASETATSTPTADLTLDTEHFVAGLRRGFDEVLGLAGHRLEPVGAAT
jgi:hypothetical protein